MAIRDTVHQTWDAFSDAWPDLVELAGASLGCAACLAGAGAYALDAVAALRRLKARHAQKLP